MNKYQQRYDEVAAIAKEIGVKPKNLLHSYLVQYESGEIALETLQEIHKKENRQDERKALKN